jgi:hypothetical protein
VRRDVPTGSHGNVEDEAGTDITASLFEAKVIAS